MTQHSIPIKLGFHPGLRCTCTEPSPALRSFAVFMKLADKNFREFHLFLLYCKYAFPNLDVQMSSASQYSKNYPKVCVNRFLFALRYMRTARMILSL